MSPQPETIKFVLRISPKLHRKIKRAAKANNTSMNRQIINELEGKDLDSAKLAQILKLLEK